MIPVAKKPFLISEEPSAFMQKLFDRGHEYLPQILHILRITLAVTLSWELARLLVGQSNASLAATAGLVVTQASSIQTLRKGIERVIAVLIGSILVLFFLSFLPLTVWTLFLVVFCAHVLGLLFQRRAAYVAVQIPITALFTLITLTTDPHATSYPLMRLLGACLGGGIGLFITLLFSHPFHIFRAHAASQKVLTAFPQTVSTLSAAFSGQFNEQLQTQLEQQLQTLERQISASRQMVSFALESARLDLWAKPARSLIANHTHILKTLEQLRLRMQRLFSLLTGAACFAAPEEQRWLMRYSRLLELNGKLLRLALLDAQKQPEDFEELTRIALAETQRCLRHLLHPDTGIIEEEKRVMLHAAILYELDAMLSEIQHLR
ncbi:fusaric acid resistance family protein [Thermosporothrix hazakensis]|jgi:uncharacterized membrane protein YgaE (UPF0421/DUF939 family)|uniref:Fusaric acid resistance family protein n=2 Tax=Thermosporothrix TaxID=768650 RepID=A0A326UCT6_THEHA|nr:fusaric acid resistance family protein [Thermosporothrix hazakensis]